MRPVNEKLAADLLEAGKQEFLEKGFQGASMRGIASRLSVTTGALYRYYTDKESLFDVLVEEPARVLEERYRAIQRNFADQPVKDQVQTLPEVSDEGHSWMVEYIYDHFDAFKLIVCCSAGTRYEHYLDVLTEIEVNSSIVLMEKMKEAGYQPEELDENLIHMVASSMFNGMFETVRHDMPREKAISYIQEIGTAYDDTIVTRYCKNETLNSVISIYKTRFLERNINFLPEIYVQKDLPCPDLSLCTILSNALENALHALEHTSGEKWVSLHIMQKENLLLLEIKNPIETMPKFIDGIPISDKKGHGIGTKSIVYYVQQLNGQCHFSVEEHCFVLKIILSRCI